MVAFEKKKEGAFEKLGLDGIDRYLLILGFVSPLFIIPFLGWALIPLSLLIGASPVLLKKLYGYTAQKIEAKNKTAEEREAQRKTALFNGLPLIAILAFLASLSLFAIPGISALLVFQTAAGIALSVPATMFAVRYTYDMFLNKEAIADRNKISQDRETEKKIKLEEAREQKYESRVREKEIEYKSYKKTGELATLLKNKIDSVTKKIGNNNIVKKESLLDYLKTAETKLRLNDEQSKILQDILVATKVLKEKNIPGFTIKEINWVDDLDPSKVTLRLSDVTKYIENFYLKEELEINSYISQEFIKKHNPIEQQNIKLICAIQGIKIGEEKQAQATKTQAQRTDTGATTPSETLGGAPEGGTLKGDETPGGGASGGTLEGGTPGGTSEGDETPEGGAKKLSHKPGDFSKNAQEEEWKEKKFQERIERFTEKKDQPPAGAGETKEKLLKETESVVTPREGVKPGDIEKLIEIAEEEEEEEEKDWRQKLDNYTEENVQNALITAAIDGDIKTIQELINKRTYLNQQDENGNTALILASNEGHEDIVDALIKAKVDLDKQDKNGNTALIFASTKGYEGIVDKLIKAGADVKLKNNKGDNALIYALTKKYGSIANKLLKAGAKVKTDDQGTKNVLDKLMKLENILKGRSVKIVSFKLGLGETTEKKRSLRQKIEDFKNISNDANLNSLQQTLDNLSKIVSSEEKAMQFNRNDKDNKKVTLQSILQAFDSLVPFKQNQVLSDYIGHFKLELNKIINQKVDLVREVKKQLDEIEVKKLEIIENTENRNQIAFKLNGDLVRDPEGNLIYFDKSRISGRLYKYLLKKKDKKDGSGGSGTFSPSDANRLPISVEEFATIVRAINAAKMKETIQKNKGSAIKTTDKVTNVDTMFKNSIALIQALTNLQNLRGEFTLKQQEQFIGMYKDIIGSMAMFEDMIGPNNKDLEDVFKGIAEKLNGVMLNSYNKALAKFENKYKNNESSGLEGNNLNSNAKAEIDKLIELAGLQSVANRISEEGNIKTAINFVINNLNNVKERVVDNINKITSWAKEKAQTFKKACSNYIDGCKNTLSNWFGSLRSKLSVSPLSSSLPQQQEQGNGGGQGRQ